MTIEHKLRAVEQALTRARENHLGTVATQEFGAVKREVRELLAGNPTLGDLFPTRVFGSDDHVATPALVGALDRARERIEKLASGAAGRAVEAGTLLRRAEALGAIRGKKAEIKRETIELLQKTYPQVWADRISWARRAFRTEHAPSADLRDALAAANAHAKSPGDRGELDRLRAGLDTLATRTALKAEINAFLGGAASSPQDLRPRRLLRVDHAPIATLIRLLDTLKAEYEALAEPRTRQSKLDKLEGLRARLVRRRELKAERDECLRRAKALKESLQGDRRQTREMIARIESELTAYAEEAETLRERLARASEDRWRAQLALEGAQRARDLVKIAAEALVDEVNLPASWDDLAARKSHLHGALAAAKAPLETARAEVVSARELYEEALATALAGDRAGALPGRERLQGAQERLFDLEQRSAIHQLELDILTSAVGGGDLDDTLAIAVKSKEDELARRATDADTEVADRRRALSESDKELDARQTELGTHEAKAQSALELHRFCLTQLDAIGLTLDRYRQLKNEYRAADALVCYITTADELGQRLRDVARLVRGRRTTVDSMGSVRLAFLIDAGVRAGVELGFVELTAEVRLTLLLEGTLAVLDSREVMFQGHLGVFISAAAVARAGLKEPLEGGLDLLGAGDILPVPDLLLEASASCKASLYDVRSCSVYDDENHWAGHWAHAITRRRLFLRNATLTSQGVATLNEAFFRAEIDKLARKPGALCTLLTLSAALETEPREFTIDPAQRVEARATASLGTQSRSIGSDPGASSWTLSERDGARSTLVGTLVEHSLDFLPKKVERDENAAGPAPTEPEGPSSFVGTAIFHSLDVASARPREFREPRAFLEVTMFGPHKVVVGELSLETAGTSAQALGGADAGMSQRYRGLSQALDASPSDTFDRLIRLPSSLEQELTARAPGGTEPASRRLARTARLRLDLLIARGEPAKLTELLNLARDLEETIEKRLETGAEKAKQAREAAQKLSALLGDLGSPAASAPIVGSLLSGTRSWLPGQADRAAELAGLGEEKLDLLRESLHGRVAELEECVTLLKNSHAGYARYVRSFRCLAPEPQTSLSWEPAWVAQVHRGICRRRLKFSVETSVHAAPFVKVFVGTSVELESQAVEFEALGPRTFSYLKSLFTKMKTDLWASWWQLHKGEIFDICESVASPGSIPFSEVVLDALEGRAELRSEARAFGEACWRAFRDDDNPFEEKVFGEPAVVRALQGKGGPGRVGATTPRPTTKVPVLPAALPRPSRDELAWLTMAYLVPIRDRLLASFAEDPSSPQANFATLIDKAVRSLQRAERLKQGLVTKYEGPDVERGGQNETRARQSLSDLLARLRGAEGENAERVAQLRRFSLRVSDRVAMARALAASIEQRLLIFSEVDQALVGHFAGITPVSFDGEGSDVVALITDGVAWVAALLRAGTRVPSLDQWKQRSSVRFMFRSGATDQLDRAVDLFHRADHLDAPFRGVMPATFHDALALAFEHIEALKTHLRRAEALREVVRSWYTGKDEGTSRRAPAVAAVLEVPLEAELRRLWLGLALLLLRIEMATRLDELLNLKRGITAAEDRAATAAQRTFRYRQDLLHADSLMKATVKLQRAFLTRKLKREQGPPPLEALKQRLLAYLKAAALDFSKDQLLHGRKKTLLRGERFPVFEVEEPTAKSDG